MIESYRPLSAKLLILFLAAGLLTAQAQTAPVVDARHLLLDGSLTDAEAQAQPFVFNDLREAVRHFTDTTTLYIRPWVYWVDNPDVPEVVRGENGREPFGCVIRGKVLRLVGLDADARNTVLASARGLAAGQSSAAAFSELADSSDDFSAPDGDIPVLYVRPLPVLS